MDVLVLSDRHDCVERVRRGFLLRSNTASKPPQPLTSDYWEKKKRAPAPNQWINLAEQRWVNLSERYRLNHTIPILTGLVSVLVSALWLLKCSQNTLDWRFSTTIPTWER